MDIILDTLQQIYSVLGLVRANNLWSWGAANENAVVLQVWTDEIKKSDSGLFLLSSKIGTKTIRAPATKNG